MTQQEVLCHADLRINSSKVKPDIIIGKSFGI